MLVGSVDWSFTYTDNLLEFVLFALRLVSLQQYDMPHSSVCSDAFRDCMYDEGVVQALSAIPEVQCTILLP